MNNLLSTETGFSDVNAFSHDLIMRLGNFFSPNAPKTWLLNITPDNYFAGLRQILKDDDPIFNSNMVTMFPSNGITTQDTNHNLNKNIFC